MDERIKELEKRLKAVEDAIGIEEPHSLKDLLGEEVVGVGKGRCDGCPNDRNGIDCHKVELVGGDFLCLAEQPRMPSFGELKKEWELIIDDTPDFVKVTNISFPIQLRDIEGNDVLEITIHCGKHRKHAIIVDIEKLRANPADVFLEEITRIGNISNLGEAYRMFKEKVVYFL